ncbi:hypothetical protein [Halobacteriovorax sp.]|uniref:hypothetical protein n=1 Tax=Halobacteriovorax sp. TaxID=2020862 RepID=UPI00356313E8
MKVNKVFIYSSLLALLIFSVSPSALAEECSDGLIWNENIEQCLSAEDDSRVNEKQKMCDSKADGAGKDECNKMVQSFDTDPKSNVDSSDVELSKKEKAIQKIGTAKSVVSAGIAAYKLYEAYSAAKSAKDVFSNMCISGMISIATGVMSFMNDRNMEKQVKQTLKISKQNLDALIKENERTKGTSYEMQIKLMQAYRQVLLAGAQSAKIREDGYKQEVTMYSLALGIAAIEAVIYAIPPNVQMDKVKCAGWVAGSATISLVLGTKMKNAASSARSKYESEAEKLENILNKYMDFFNKKHIDSTTLSTQLAINGSSGAPINVSSSTQANNFSNKNLTTEQVEMCEAAPSTECCNDSGKTCPTFSVSFGSPTVSSAVGKSGLTGALERADARLSGNLNLSDSGVSLAIDNDLKRAGAFKQRILDQLKDKGRLSDSQAEMFDENKQMKAFLKKNYGSESANLSSSFGDSMALPDVDRISSIIEKSDVPKELKGDKDKLSSSMSKFAALSKINSSLGSLGLELEGDSNGDNGLGDELAQDSGLAEGEEYIYDDNQIVEKPEVSIFQVISNRYNVLRINKRFGQRAVK